jgi:acetoacetate decarboxylase
MPKTVRSEPVPWKTADLVQNAFTMPLTRPSLPRAPYLYRNREHLIMTYHTDRRS